MNRLNENDTPLALVRKWQNKIPSCYAALDNVVATMSHIWPDVCPVPISAAYAVVMQLGGGDRYDATIACAEMTACYAWRKHKIIYRFDPDLSAELAAQARDYKSEDTLPIDIMLHPPYPCVYISCPGVLGEYVHGFFAWIEWDTNRSIYEFRVQNVMKNMQKSLPLMLDLCGDTLQACIGATISESARNGSRPFPVPKVEEMQIILTALNHYLYICSADADTEPDPVQSRITRRTPEIRDKFREIELKNVGVRIGSALRRSRYPGHTEQSERTPGTGVKKRPHTRRGHWHHYWTGPKSNPQERKLILKWTHPILVGASEAEEQPAIIIPIKK